MGRRSYTGEQIINNLRLAKVLIENLRREYNQARPIASPNVSNPNLTQVVSLLGTGQEHVYTQLRRVKYECE
jgi:hypothetical protein